MVISKKELTTKLREWKLSLFLYNRNLLSRISLILLIVLILIAIFAPVLAPYPEDAGSVTHPEIALRGPSLDHPFGTDELGRDILSKVIYGCRISLISAMVTVLFALIIGSFLGAIAGGIGGWVEEVIMRITDIFLSFPPLLLAICITALMGASLEHAQLAMILSWWPWYTRILRGQAVGIKERQFVKSAEAIGTSSWRIIFKHIVPNCMAPIIIQASMDMGAVIMTLASLGYLGLGAQAPSPEWGLMVNTSKTYIMQAPWYTIFPSLAIFVTVLVFNLIGDGLREVLDPKTRKL